jgi:hypothetical protein
MLTGVLSCDTDFDLCKCLACAHPCFNSTIAFFPKKNAACLSAGRVMLLLESHCAMVRFRNLDNRFWKSKRFSSLAKPWPSSWK